MTVSRRTTLALWGLLFLTTASINAQSPAASEDLPRRFIVVLANGTSDVASLAAEMASIYGGRLEPYQREGERSFAISITPSRARFVAADPRVRSVSEILPDGSTADAARPRELHVISEAAAAPAPVSNYVSTQWSTGPYQYDAAGDIISVGPNSDGNTDRYSYDAVGRLLTATAHTASRQNSQSFVYDEYGNLKRIDTAGSGPTIINVDSTTNRLSPTLPSNPPAGATVVFGDYDVAGNQTSLNGTYQYAWDGLGMMRQLTSGARIETYLYDSSDERVVTIRGPVSGAANYKYTIRDEGGRVLRVFSDDFNGTTHNFSWDRDYAYRDALLLGTVARGPDGSETRRHFHLDHLGTPRLITDDSGRRIAMHTYWPYGQEAPGSDSDDEVMKFTGHERDFGSLGDTNVLDYMHARFDNPNIGRFLSVDHATPARKNPQSWNRYVYGGDNPIKYLDPSGQVELTFTLLSRIPGEKVPVPWYHPGVAITWCWTCSLKADGEGEKGITFSHDTNRYRTKQTVTIETDPEKSKDPIKDTEQTAGASEILDSSGAIKEIGHAKSVGKITASHDKDGNAVINIVLDSSMPLLKGSPAISAEIQITVSKDGHVVKVTGVKDGFPAYHLFVTNDKGKTTDIFRFNPYDHGHGANALWGWTRYKVKPIVCDPYATVRENCKTDTNSH